MLLTVLSWSAFASPPSETATAPPDAEVRALVWSDEVAEQSLRSLLPYAPEHGQVVLLTVLDTPPRVEPEPNPATMTLVVPPGVHATSFEAICPSGFRQRASFVDSVARLPDVPDEDCTVLLKGGSALARFKGGPDAYACFRLGRNSNNLVCQSVR